MAALKRSAKGEMTSSDCRARSKKPSSSKTAMGNVISEGIKSTVKNLSWRSSGVTALKRSTKKAVSCFFRICTLYKALYKQNYYRNVICNGFAQSPFKVDQ